MHGSTFIRRGLSRSKSTLLGTSRRQRIVRPAVYGVLALAVCFAAATMPSRGHSDQAQAAPGPVGNGFTVTPADLAFILKQIKISERHARAYEGNPDPGTPLNPDPVGDPEYCQALVGPGPNQIPDRLSSYGLRTVDGSCNNLFPARDKFAAADVPFPRLTNPVFSPAEASPTDFFGPGSGTIPSSSYAQKKGLVFDSQPRVISNLIVDQTSTNPAAVAAAAFPVRTQGNVGVHPCTIDPDPTALPTPIVGVPDGCVPSHKTLFIPNVTTDVGLSPPYNSLFTFFGQFFDHGVDQTVKSGGTVFVPLHADDPLITLGPDGKAGTGDEVPPGQQFMVLTRAQNQPGPDGILGDDPSTPAVDESADDVQNANNTDTPWVDQSQTYTSHSSHQVFVREYQMNSLGRPVSTGKLLGGLPFGGTYPNSPDGTDGIGNWAAVKKQAAEKLGLLLVDTDVTNVPMIATDPYGKFIPGPARGLPQYVTKTGALVEGNLAAPVPVPANVQYFDTPFLTDIAHNADPSPVDTDHNPATPPVAPAPDGNTTPSADFAAQAPGTYDDEMLNAHFVCGDGRCNENIALSTIHQVFHSEHDRLVDYIKNVLTTDTSASGIAALAEWKPGTADVTPDGWNGERLFQAARFVTEMEYQHLVFEEFARKVQPAVRPFHVYSPDINPAVEAEFAHAVYRFGHSMLDDDVARTTTNANGSKTDNSLPLLTAFLNPPEFFQKDHGNANPADQTQYYTPQEAAGAIVMGSSDQVGNELDEFVTETLRNNLLGLPLDLPVLNLTRARDAGIPPLNEVRRQIHAETNDGQLAPYTSWTDFGQHLKHPESLINFVAAYGTHPSITSETTLAGKRAAAKLIVDPTNPADPAIPSDAADFMFSNGPVWGNDPNGVTNTGLDKVDLWVGGLAETTNLFGGLLGSTFNYVFQTQLEKLQDGDRLYYLARTPGMNLRTQLEGNSFSELIQRNTDGTNSLKADAFATADCKFELANLDGTAAGFALHGGIVADDPSTTDCNETLLLLRQPNGTIQYRARNTIDPVGINGQAVYNGTDGVDRIYGGNDNDTFWGGKGNDILEGNGGDDVILGGEGNDIITDLDGADVPKGGPGNDAIDAGPGDDIVLGADGADFLNGGSNDNETFAGPGNDYIIAGQGADAVFGDSGDDWIEGGTGQDLLQGDHGAPFFDDPAQVAPGNDIFIGQPGENDYDTEGGDDLMAQNAAIDRNAGAGGFDWAFHQYDTVGANDDMEINNNLVGVPIQVVVNRDRWQETEADSGSPFNDIIKGTSVAPNTLGGAGFTGCDILDQAGVDRIAGLSAIVPQPLTESSATVVANSAAGFCPVTGPVFGAGDILIGGPGSDTIEGRGADDIIDGDRYLTVRISVRDAAGIELGSTDLMEHPALSGNFGPGTLPNTTLQQAVFSGAVDPGNLVPVRELKSDNVAPDCGTPAPVNCDTAVFSGLINAYVITHNSNGSVTVDSQGGTDGIDTLWNIEKLQFADTTIDAPTATVNAPPVGTVTLSTLTPTEGIALTATPAFTDANGINLPTLTLTWELELTPGVWGGAGVLGQTFTPGNFEVGHALRVVATYIDNDGFPETVISAATAPVINVNDVPTGAPALTDLTPTEGDVLTAATSSIADADGLTGVTFNFQWQQSGNGGGGAFTNIAGAPNSANFTPAQAQVNRALRVVVSYTDNHGTPETLTSPVTGVTGDLFIGTAGADNFTGTAGEDHIFGRGGNDTLNGANGNDIIAGEGGNDTVNGGNGDDTVQFTGTGDGFDAVTGAAGNDAIVATTAGTNVGLTSIATTEFITDNGLGGLHVLGSNNADTLNFTAVTLTNVVNIDGGGGADTLTGSQNADVILGGAANDTINGGNGNDTIIGGAGNDTLNGQGDNDTFQFAGTGNGFDAVTGAAGTDRVEATSNATNIGLSSIATVEQVSANAFTGVHVVGTANADTLNFGAVTFTGVIDVDGAAGADTLTGSAASDTIIGGAGNDNITPGAGNDRLRFAAGFGQDTITGFDSNPAGGQDKLDIQALGITSATFAASVTITNVGGNTRIQIGANRITLNGVAAATVDATDFDLNGQPLSPLSLSGSVSRTSGARVAFQVSSQARLLSVASGKWGAVKARFVFAPKGFKFNGAKTIVKARDAKGRTVLLVQAKGSEKHGYKVRIVGGAKHSKWLTLRGKPVALVAALSAKTHPTLIPIHG